MAKDYVINVTVNGKDNNASGVFETVGGNAVTWLGKAAAAALSAATVMKGLNIARDFEEQMSAVEAVAMATKNEMELLRQKAIDLGRDTAFSSSQVAKGMEELAKAGLTPKQVYEAIGPMLSLAAAGSLDLAEAAGIAAAALNQFSLPASDAQRVSDVLAKAANMSAADVRSLGNALTYAGGYASMFGLSLEETTAAISLMSKKGIDGTMAGTSLRDILADLSLKSDKFGISLTDTHGNMLPFSEILKQLEPYARQGADGVAKINEMFGVRGGTGLLALLTQGTDELKKFETGLIDSKGAAQLMGETKLDNLNGAVEQLKGSLEALAIGALSSENDQSIIGGMKHFVTDGLVPAVNAVTNLVTQNNGLSSALGMVFDGWGLIIGLAIPAIINGWSDLLSLVGGLLTGLEGLLKGFASSVSWTMQGIFTLVSGSLEAAMGSVQSVVISVLNFLGSNATQTFNDLIEPIRGLLGKIGIEIGTFDWTPLTTTPTKTFTQVWGDAKDQFGFAKDSMSQGIDDFKGSVIDACLKINEQNDTTFTGPEGMGKKAAKAAGDAAEAIGKLPQATGTAMSDSAGAVTLFGPQLTKAYGDHVDEMKASIGTLPGTVELAFLGIKGTVEYDLADLEADWEEFIGLCEYVAEHNTIGAKFFGAVESGWNSYIEALPDWEQSVTWGMQDIMQSIDKTLSGGFSDFIKHGKLDFSKGMKEVGDAGAQAIGDALSAYVLKNLVDPGIKAIQGAFGEAFSGISSGLGSVIGGVTGSLISAGLMQAGAAIINEVVGAFTPDYEARRKDRERSNALTRDYYTLEGIGAELTGSEWGFNREELFRTAARMDEIIKVRGNLNNATSQEQIEYLKLAGQMQDMEQAVSAGVGYRALQEAMKANPDYLASNFGGTINFKELEDLGRRTEEFRGIMPWQFLQNLPQGVLGDIQKNVAQQAAGGAGVIADFIKMIDKIQNMGDPMSVQYPGLPISIARQMYGPTVFHGGGATPGEGWFLGLEGEGILNRKAMSNLGADGLARLNQGGGTGTQNVFIIYAWDGEDVENAVRRKIIPQLREMSEAGEVIIHERGVKSA